MHALKQLAPMHGQSKRGFSSTWIARVKYRGAVKKLLAVAALIVALTSCSRYPAGDVRNSECPDFILNCWIVTR